MFSNLTRRLGGAGMMAVGVAVGLWASPVMAAEVVTYGSLPDPGFEAVVWAITHGKVSDPNVTVKVEQLPSIPAAIQAAMTSQFNLIGAGTLAIPQLRESGIPVQVVSTLIRYHPEGHSADLWVMKDSPYKDVHDLKGKTIAVTSGEAQNVVSIRWVIGERFHMNSDIVGGDFKWVDMPQQQFEAALQSGRVDAAAIANVPSYAWTKTGTYRSVVHGSMELQSMFGGPMPSVVVFGYEADLNKRPDAYVAATRLMKVSADYVRKNPDEVFADVAPKYNMTKDDLQTWFTTFAEMTLALGPTDKQVMAKAWETAVKYGQLKKAPTSVDDLVWSKAVMQ